MIDRIAYIDTDSLFIMIGDFLKSQGISEELWNSLNQETKTKYVLEISKIIENNVNERAYNEVQLNHYNSIVDKDDFCIKFKQEIYCSTALFLAPKMYCYRVLNDEGFSTDRIDAKGLEIVRSNAPKAFRQVLKKFIKLLLNEGQEEDLKNLLNEEKSLFFKVNPDDIAINIGVNNLRKYINVNFSYKKGTPYQVKGVANYHWLLKELKLSHKYESIHEGDKIKCLYLKKNKYNLDVLSFYTFPKEFFDYGIIPDYNKMIEKYFNNKLLIILEPINKENIINCDVIDDFF